MPFGHDHRMLPGGEQERREAVAQVVDRNCRGKAGLINPIPTGECPVPRVTTQQHLKVGASHLDFPRAVLLRVSWHARSGVEPGFRIILDRRGVSVPESSDFVERFLALVDRQGAGLGNSRWTIVVCCPCVVFGIARMLASRALARGVAMEAFVDVEEALTWLGLPLVVGTMSPAVIALTTAPMTRAEADRLVEELRGMIASPQDADPSVTKRLEQIRSRFRLAGGDAVNARRQADEALECVGEWVTRGRWRRRGDQPGAYLGQMREQLRRLEAKIQSH